MMFDLIMLTYLIGVVLAGFAGGIYCERTGEQEVVGPILTLSIAWPVVLFCLPIWAGWWVGKLVSHKKDPTQ
ncbi:MAG: hypothetical protein WCO83_02295 [Alphaproteobacteria bacterium]